MYLHPVHGHIHIVALKEELEEGICKIYVVKVVLGWLL